MKLTEHTAPLWPAYRLVAEGWASLGEIDAMTLDDILDANDALDAVLEARRPEK